jgi:2,3-dimethylmalate lyase
MKNAGNALRQLLSQDGCVIAPGCFDAFTGRLIQEAGFSAAYLGGSQLNHSLFGQPSVGYATLTEYVWHSGNIANALDIPLVLDAETGFGNVIDVQRTVRDLARAGVAGAHIEDEGHPGGVELDQVRTSLLPLDVAVRRYKAAREALEGTDFVLIARTDSAALGVEEMIRRSTAYLEAGVDMVWPIMSHFMTYTAHLRGSTEGSPYEDQMRIIERIVREVPGKLMFHSPHGRDLKPEDANRLGVKMLVCPAMSLGSAGPAVLETLVAYREGRLEEHYQRRPPMAVKEVDRRVRMDYYRDLVKRYGFE